MTEDRHTIDQNEIAHFSRLAEQWWNPRGSWATLNKFNLARLSYIRDRAAGHFGRDPQRPDCLAELRLLDMGCGGGLLTEPLARLGATLVGADPSESNIAVARRHAADAGLSIDYRSTTAEALSEADEAFDIVLAMEVVEHVADAGRFIDLTAGLVKPGGLMFVGTLNRTLKSFVLAIVGAEYILGWIPRGTHRWDKFVTPKELKIAMERNGLHYIDEAGVIYNLFANQFQLAATTDVSYMVVAERTR